MLLLKPTASLRVASALALVSFLGATPHSDLHVRDHMDPEFIRATVDSLASVVDREYFDPEVAAHVSASLRRWSEEGRYAALQKPQPLAEALTRDLFATTHDKHLSVAVVPDVAVGQNGVDESRDVQGRRANFGVQRTEILPGNVGVLNLTRFYRPVEARDAISAAMQVLRNADALILDLRAKGGGSPETVALVLSYLFDAPGLPLFDIVPRGTGGDHYTTDPGPLPERDGRRPVYALTSRRTWSAGEGLAFILQERHRAEVIGETTAGAANPGRPYPINARFTVTVPNGKVRSAVSGRNWEGIGVVPDVAVPAARALEVAHAHALREVLKAQPEGPWRNTLERELKRLETNVSPSTEGGGERAITCAKHPGTHYRRSARSSDRDRVTSPRRVLSCDAEGQPSAETGPAEARTSSALMVSIERSYEPRNAVTSSGRSSS
jgi:hypothetical protein